MEMFRFFWLQFHHAYDSAYNSDFLFSQDDNCSYDAIFNSDSRFVASENQP